jgi:hypothetical protein
VGKLATHRENPESKDSTNENDVGLRDRFSLAFRLHARFVHGVLYNLICAAVGAYISKAIPQAINLVHGFSDGVSNTTIYVVDGGLFIWVTGWIICSLFHTNPPQREEQEQVAAPEKSAG